jgi:phospholipase C
VLGGAAGDPDKMLPQVVFIEAGMAKSGLDEHPGVNIQKGATDVQRILTALMNSDAWQHSVFIFSFDEAGGLYDHVAPVQVPEPDAYQPGQCPEPNPKSASCGWGPQYIRGRFDITGMRLPLIVISPWAKPHFVSHIPRDTTAILAFIETTFNMPPLTKRDQYFQDPTRNMDEFFDFSNAALLNAPTGQQWPSYLPAQPNNGVCSFNKEVGPTS